MHAGDRSPDGSRCVEDEDLRIDREGEGESDLRVLPLRQDAEAGARIKKELLGERPVAVEVAGLLEAGREPADLADRHPVVELGPFGDVADALAELPGAFPGVESEDTGVTAVRRSEAVEDADGGRLAGMPLSPSRAKIEPLGTERLRESRARFPG